MLGSVQAEVMEHQLELRSPPSWAYIAVCMCMYVYVYVCVGGTYNTQNGGSRSFFFFFFYRGPFCIPGYILGGRISNVVYS